jgi:hypothetical protein
MQLDLTNNGRLSIEDSILIDRISLKVQKEYNLSTGDLVVLNNLSGLDLLISVVSRNPFQTSILPSLCKLCLLDEKLKNGDRIDLIILQDSNLIDAINSILEKFNQTIPIQVYKKNNSIRLLLFCFLNLIKSIYLITINWLWPRISMTGKKIINEKIILVDNFIFPSSFSDDNVFIDRYYTGYEKYLNQSQKKKIWYIPTLFGFKTLGQFLKMSNQAKKSKTNFIFQESWLSLSDYVSSLYLSTKIPFVLKKTNLFMGFNIDKLLISEARKDFASPSLMLAICKYKFITNLKKSNIEICHVVDWNENQIIDKALVLAMSKEYPKIDVKGYQGHVSSSYETHKIPQTYELENGLIPNKMFVISKQYKETVLKSCPNLDVILSSAFRFSYLYDINRSNLDTEILTVLIALPMNIDDSKGILNSCANMQKIVKQKIKILVKHHPGYSESEFVKKVPEFYNNSFNVTHDSMYSLLGKVSILISSASSVSVEAASLGIPVAIYGSRQGVTLNPIPEDTNNFENNIFYSKKQLEIFINNCLNKSNNNSSIEKSFLKDNGFSARKLFVCD